MRPTILSGLLATLMITPTTAVAQWAVGILGGAGQDHGWQGRTGWMGALVERRLSDSSSFVLRLTGTVFSPMERTYGELIVLDDGSTAVEAVMNEVIGRAGASLAVRWPFLTVPCDGGYHRGAYLMAGAGWDHAVVRQDGFAVQEEVGQERVLVRQRRWTQDRFLAQASVGAQYGTRWGSPFVEVGLHVGAMPYDMDRWGITQAGFQLGYRYVFVRR